MSSSKPMDLESRIADLDERLRRARAESITTVDFASPVATPPVPEASKVALNLTPPARYFAGPIRSPMRALSNDASPWEDVSRQTLQADDQELNQLLDRQKRRASSKDQQLRDTQGQLQHTNASVARVEQEITRNRRQRDVNEAQVARVATDAERRLLNAERDYAALSKSLNDSNAQRELLSRQLEETKVAVRRAEMRLVELTKDQQALENKLQEQNAAAREVTMRTEDESTAFNRMKRKLELRLQEVNDELASQTDRLKKTEASFSAQQASWNEQEKTIRHDIDVLASQVSDAKDRLEAAQQELTEREREAEIQRRQRERRLEEIIARRTSERSLEIERLSSETSQRLDSLRREKEQIHQQLRQQLDEVLIQVEKKRRIRDSQKDAIDLLRSQMATLQQTVEEKQSITFECERLEAENGALESRVMELRVDVQDTQQKIDSSRDQISTLRAQARKLHERLNEESRLKELLADTAAELTEAELRHAEELCALEKQEGALLAQQQALEASVATAQHEADRQSQDASVELDVLSRRIAGLRQQVLDKEAQLNKQISDNALKQASIAQFEEERRRLEREQMQRKASAALAARAALSELAL